MRKGLVALFIIFTLVLSACSSNSKEGGANKPTESPNAQQEQNNGEADKDKEKDKENQGTDTGQTFDDGVDEAKLKETLDQFPAAAVERVVTTSVPITEMLHVLGVTPVGVPTSTNPIPAAFDQVERIGSPMQPDLEVVTALQPQLLIGAESLRSTLEKNLEGIKLERAYMRTESFDDLKLSFKALGTYFNKQEEMNAVLKSISDKEAELEKKAEGKQLPTVMLIIGTSDSFMVMSEKSYLGSLVNKLGADNIATSVLKVSDTYSPINMENVVAADPDIILVLASGDHGATEDKFQKEVEKNEIWTKLSAYQNKKVHILDYSMFGVTSISNVEKALTKISEYFYQ